MKTTLVLHSALAPDAVIAALRRSVDGEQKTLFSFSGYKGNRPVLGEVSDSSFRLQKRRYWRNDFAPRFYGKVEPEYGGTRIEGYFDMTRWVKLFMRVWLGGVVLFGGPLFVMSLLDVTTGSHHTTGDTWVGVIVPPSMILFGILLPKFGRLLGCGEERFLLEFLQGTLAARVEEMPGVR